MQNSVKIIVIDYYMSTPIPNLDVTYSEFRSASVSQVPVLRCFGATKEGKKICVHIHGVFPYLYIPYDGQKKPEELIYQITTALDKAINVSFNQASSTVQHIYQVSLVSGIPMYGFHSKPHQFFKIYLYNPKLMSKVASLLLNQNILGQSFQPHESHLNFTLQFMIDYNLHGMSDMIVTGMKYRANLANMDSNNLPLVIEKTTLCELEADIMADNIVNKWEILEGKLAANPGILALWEDERQRRRNQDLNSQLGDFLEMKNTVIPPTKTQLVFQQALKERLAVAATTDKDNNNTKLQNSVYPAETPSDSSIQIASFVNIHSASTSESFLLDDTLNISSSQSFNETLQPNNSNYNLTLDQEALELVNMLETLAKEKPDEEEPETDGILSQIVPDEPNDESVEDLMDLSLPLGSLTTPIKIHDDAKEDVNRIKDKSYFNLIPQVDGNFDSDSEDRKCKIQKKVKPGRSMPILDENNVLEDIFQLDKLELVPYVKLNKLKLDLRVVLERLDIRKHFKKLPINKMENTLRLIRYRINKIRSKNRMDRIQSVLKANYKHVSNPSGQMIKPKLHIVPANNEPSLSSLPVKMMYINCDGTLDSSSEEETLEKTPLKVENIVSVHYAPLGISVNSFPSISNPKLNEPSHKRKLVFSEKDSTTEEFLSCAYSSKHSKHLSFAEIYSQNNEPSNSQDYDRNSSGESDDLFPESDIKTLAALTVSELYDRNNKYKAKEGSSAFLTSSSETIATNNSEILPNQTKRIKNSITLSLKAPTRSRIESTLTQHKIPRIQPQVPFYSNINDYTGTIEVGQRIMRIASNTSAHLPEFDSEYSGIDLYRKYFTENVANLTWNSNNKKSLKLAYCQNNPVVVVPIKKPPSVKSVKKWLQTNSLQHNYEEVKTEVIEAKEKIYISNESDLELSMSLTPYQISQASNNDDSSSRKLFSDQISGTTQNNTFGFDKSVQNLQACRTIVQHQYLTTLVMELHIRTRGELKPDPQFDPVCAIFYSILNDIPSTDKSRSHGAIAINRLPVDVFGNEFTANSRPDFLNGIKDHNFETTYVDSEIGLINSFMELIRKWDPDILAGYEIEMLSWGYLVERASVLAVNLLPLLGRSEQHKFGKTKLKYEVDQFETSVVGRIILNVWRIMRHEIALQSYTFESIVYHILHRRVPMNKFKDLSFWWDHDSNLYRHRVVSYYRQRVDTILELMNKLDFLNRTSELAKLFGIMFYEVLSRGSQFRVESMMLRLAKPLNYVPVSPDVKQRAQMKAPEYIPLVMEPESKLYTDPVIVLDFQSLYPSIIIAYNYCFTTCAGRVSNLGTNQPFEFGATQLKLPKRIVEKLCKKDLLNYSPCGVAFVKRRVREGILPRMLKEVLDTRLMVKNSMKENKGDGNLQKVLHNRQLGLKLIANVTYGYTAANFSGRMCCVEVGDSVVSKGRETLQRAIALVENTKEWEAKVVYGDTDSMFVLVPGKTRKEAFEIGKKIAEAVTADNPDPIKLKLEKVYQPCILQTKKRYVGYMYENPDDKEPIYEAKGIETVRRDGCPVVSKMLKKCLTLLFDTKDVSLIKNYVVRQFSKVLTGRVSIQDLTFAKEYRGSGSYRPGACVPALELTRKWGLVDKRSEPRRGERVPYIIINGPPGLPLIRLVRSPRDLLTDPSLRPNALYYITKVIIPPINRCLNLIGADVNVWFNQMPRKNSRYLPNSSPVIKSVISQYFVSKFCASCSAPTMEGLCEKCLQRPNVTTLTLSEKLKTWEENYQNSLLICQSCTNCLDQIVCASLDCPVLYRKTQTFQDLQQSSYVRDILTNTSLFLENNYFSSSQN